MRLRLVDEDKGHPARWPLSFAVWKTTGFNATEYSKPLHRHRS
jgi:hypothetical protein